MIIMCSYRKRSGFNSNIDFNPNTKKHVFLFLAFLLRNWGQTSTTQVTFTFTNSTIIFNCFLTNYFRNHGRKSCIFTKIKSCNYFFNEFCYHLDVTTER